MRRLLALVFVGGAAALIVLAGPASAAKKASISVSPSTVAPGGVVHISGSIPVKGCPASDSATVVGNAALFPPDGFGPSANRNSHGAFALDYTVPTSTPAGTYDVGVRCGGANVGVSAALIVSAGPLGGPGTGAGGTAGSSSVPWAFLGAVCLLLSGVLIVFRRRLARRTSGTR
jgi:hypothetical protein